MTDHPALLSVGSGRDRTTLPIYADHKVSTLDIDPDACPDILCDARYLHKRSALRGKFDVIYCSHNLEHYYKHDVPQVMRGFLHALRPHGLLHIRVPDVYGTLKYAFANNLDIEDAVFASVAGQVRVVDVLYGYSRFIEGASKLSPEAAQFMAHKTGFTEESLVRALTLGGFSLCSIDVGNFEISVVAEVAAQ